MKPLIALLSLSFVTLSAFIKPETNVKTVLIKVSQKLNSIKAIGYNYKRIIDYPDENYHSELAADAYIDFNPAYQLVGFRYQFNNDNTLAIYNGTESFFCDKKENTIELNNFPKVEGFRHSSCLFNSPVTIKNVLPNIIADDHITKKLYDTTLDNKSFYVADIILKNETLDALGEYVPTTKELTFSYRLIIDKSTYMPVEVIQRTIGNKDLTRTLFTNINLAPADRKETSWYSSSYETFTLKKDAKIELIKPGVAAPKSSLNYFSNQKPESLKNLKGKVVLLEFWIKDCGHCIEAVQPLNSIYAAYKSKDFKLLSVNIHDSREMVDFFIKKHDIKYDVMTADKTIEKDYGIFAFPQVVLVDKNGTVIYSGDFDSRKLDDLIKQKV